MLATALLVLTACGPSAETPSVPVVMEGAADAPRLALVIAVGAYADPDVTPLPNPIRDARLVTASLRSVGFQLPITLPSNPSKAELEDALADFRSEVDRAGENAVALIYFAGHGVQVFGVNYLMPSDARMPRNIPQRASEQLVSAALVQNNFVPVLDLLLTLDGRGDGTNILVLDACREDSVTRSIGRNATRGLAESRAPGSMLIMYSTASGELAADGQDGEYSPFARAFAASITTPGSMESVKLRIKAQVDQDTGGGQEPIYLDNLRTTFCFAGCGAATDGVQTNAPSPVLCAQAETDWGAVAAESSITVVATFLDSVPERCGLMRGRARDRLNALNAAADAAYQQAVSVRTRDGYEAYLATYPGHAREDDVRNRLASCSVQMVNVATTIEHHIYFDNRDSSGICRDDIGARCANGRVSDVSVHRSYDRTFYCSATCTAPATRRERQEVCE